MNNDELIEHITEAQVEGTNSLSDEALLSITEQLTKAANADKALKELKDRHELANRVSAIVSKAPKLVSSEYLAYYEDMLRGVHDIEVHVDFLLHPLNVLRQRINAKVEQVHNALDELEEAVEVAPEQDNLREILVQARNGIPRGRFPDRGLVDRAIVQFDGGIFDAPQA